MHFGVEWAKYKKDFKLGAYKLNDTYAEIPAKVVAMMVTGRWDEVKEAYPNIDAYITNVLCEDTWQLHLAEVF